MIDTIILAGGKSSRFKSNKMSTLINGKPVLYHTLKAFIDISNSITIVTGFYDVEYLNEFIDTQKVQIVYNENHELGMFSSILKGVSTVRNDFFVIPGDYPLIQKETLEILRDEKGLIKVPVYNGRKGHPICISKKLIQTLLNEPISSNLKEFRNRHPVNYINVNDEGVLLDIDYIDDYKNIKERVK